MSDPILSEVEQAQQAVTVCLAMLEAMTQQMTEIQKRLWLADHEIRKERRERPV